MDYIKNRANLRGRCVRRKNDPIKATELVSITSSAPMELVYIDFLALEKSKRRTAEHLSDYRSLKSIYTGQLTRNRKTTTTAEVLFEIVFLHYVIFAVLHGENFESNYESDQEVMRNSMREEVEDNPLPPDGE